AGPPEKDMEWSDSGIRGAELYLQRVWRIAHKWHERLKNARSDSEALRKSAGLTDYQKKLRRRVHQIIKSITVNFDERLRLNTCISSLMELTNEIYSFDGAVEKNGSVSDLDVALASEAFNALFKMLVPFAPHIVEEMWEATGHAGDIISATWPEYIDELTTEDEIEVPVQVNGKLRSRIYVNSEASEDELKQAALGDEKVKAAASGHTVAKVIVVPKKLVNVVIR
ncbi:MAG: class I tRNA ligase family protein, partial [Blastocatellia bacterium]